MHIVYGSTSAFTEVWDNYFQRIQSDYWMIFMHDECCVYLYLVLSHNNMIPLIKLACGWIKYFLRSLMEAGFINNEHGSYD